MKKSIVIVIMFIFIFLSNTAIAQISIEEISVGSSNYGTEFRPPYIIVKIKNTSVEKKENLLVLAFVDNQPMLKDVKVDIIYPGQEKELYFFWKPELGEREFSFRVELLTTGSTDGVSKIANTVSTEQIQITMKIAHKVDPPVHQYIAFEALEILEGTTAYSEMSDHIGDVQYYDQDHPYDDSGSTICEGAEEEDQWGDSGIFIIYPPDEPGREEITYFTHFWNPNNGYSDGLDYWEIKWHHYLSAVEKAIYYW